MTVGILLVL